MAVSRTPHPVGRMTKSPPLGLRFHVSRSPMAGPIRLGGRPQRRLLPMAAPRRGGSLRVPPVFARLFGR